jgi:hypothetical protein
MEKMAEQVERMASTVEVNNIRAGVKKALEEPGRVVRRRRQVPTLDRMLYHERHGHPDNELPTYYHRLFVLEKRQIIE